MLSEQADALRRDGATAIFIGIEEAAAGIFAIADPVREPTPDALAALRREGIAVVMLPCAPRTPAEAVRSEERRGGKRCCSTCRSRWAPRHLKTKPYPRK